MDSRASLDPWIIGIASTLAAALFATAYFVESPLQDLALGMATSFVFFVVVDLIFATQRRLKEGRLRRFFGDEMVSGQLWLNCADFELHSDATGILAAHGQAVYWQRPPVPDTPHHAQPITFRWAMAFLDIQGLMAVATMLSGRQREAPALVSDLELWRNRDRSFVAAGLTSNHCTEMYLQTDEPPLFHISSADGVPTVTLADGREFVDSPQREYALILRYAPDRLSAADRRWFLIAGLEEAGTAAAGDHLARAWGILDRLTRPDDDFVAVVSIHRDQWQASRLEYVLARNGAGLRPPVYDRSHEVRPLETLAVPIPSR